MPFFENGRHNKLPSVILILLVDIGLVAEDASNPIRQTSVVVFKHFRQAITRACTDLHYNQ